MPFVGQALFTAKSLVQEQEKQITTPYTLTHLTNDPTLNKLYLPH